MFDIMSASNISGDQVYLEQGPVCIVLIYSFYFCQHRKCIVAGVSASGARRCRETSDRRLLVPAAMFPFTSLQSDSPTDSREVCRVISATMGK